MKKLLILTLFLASQSTFAQNPTKEFDAEKWDPPYSLITPEGWGVERFLIPIEFAPSIPYKGVEDLRFAPGWSDPKSGEYWTYAFLWYLDDAPETNSKIIERNLTAYYTGLVDRNIERRKIPAEKIVPVETSIKQVNTHPGDSETYSGTIDMLDYMEQQPITLNCIVHLKSCAGQNKTFIFYEISPQALTDKAWISLNQLWTSFDCSKGK